MVLGDECAPGAAALEDSVGAGAAGALQGGTGAFEAGGVLEQEAGDAAVEAKRFTAVGGRVPGLGAQGVQGGRVPAVHLGAFGVAGPVPVNVPQVESGEVGQSGRTDHGAQRVVVRVDVRVRDADQIAEEVPVGADDEPRARRVQLPDPGAQPVQEAQGETFTLVGEPADDLGGVGGLAGEAGEGEADRAAVRHQGLQVA